MTYEDILKPGGELRFYNSTIWKRKRAEIFKRDRHECRMCKEEGRYSRANCVHHIIHLKANPMLGLINSNLLSLCNSCHDKVHPEKLGHKPQFKNKEWF